MKRTLTHSPRISRRRGVAVELVVVVAAMAALIAAVIGGLIGANVATQQGAGGPGNGAPTATTTGTMDLYTEVQEGIDDLQERYDQIDLTALEDARTAVEDALDAGEDPGEALDAYGDAYQEADDGWQAILSGLTDLEDGPLGELEALDPTLALGLRSYLDGLRDDVEADMALFPPPGDLEVEPCEGDDCDSGDEPETVEETAPVWEAVITYERLETGVDVIRACGHIEEPMPGESAYESEKEQILEAHLTSDYEYTSFTYTSPEPITPEEGELLREYMARVLGVDQDSDEEGSDDDHEGDDDEEDENS